MNEDSQNSNPADAATLKVIAEELGNDARSKVNKETGFTPDSWDAYEFREPRGLHLPIHRMLKSSIWYLIFRVPVAFVANLLVAWLPLLPPRRSFLRAIEMLSLGSESSTFPPNTITLSFQVVTINFSWHFWSGYPTLPFLGLDPEKIRIQDDTCTPVFRAAWFTKA